MKNEKGGVKKYKTYKRHNDARWTYNAQTQKKVKTVHQNLKKINKIEKTPKIRKNLQAG